MKNIFFLIVLATWLGACASNKPAESANEASANSGMPPGQKKVCKHERNSGGVSRLRRVCHYVDVDDGEAK